MTHAEHAQRRGRVAAHFGDWKIDALVVTSLVNVRYLTGFTGSNAILILEPGRAVLITDGRYQTQVRQESDVPARVVHGGALKAVAPILKRRKLKTVGFESAHLTHEAWAALAKAVEGVAALTGVTGAVEPLRMVKSPAEVELIRAAVDLNSVAFDRATRRVKEGMRERDLAAEIDFQMLRAGADKPAFETIVAFGARSALPHARPTANPLQPDELLLIDMGAQRLGYTSDMTRMAVLGKPSAETRRLYGAVLESQLAAIDAVRPGVTAQRVDRAARETLRGHGLDKLFLHSTGHGLGLEIHEPPRLGKKEATKLEAGMVITIEPGAYREGFAGVRIEDTVLVTKTGCEVLTPTSKELLVL